MTRSCLTALEPAGHGLRPQALQRTGVPVQALSSGPQSIAHSENSQASSAIAHAFEPALESEHAKSPGQTRVVPTQTPVPSQSMSHAKSCGHAISPVHGIAKEDLALPFDAAAAADLRTCTAPGGRGASTKHAMDSAQKPDDRHIDIGLVKST